MVHIYRNDELTAESTFVLEDFVSKQAETMTLMMMMFSRSLMIATATALLVVPQLCSSLLLHPSG